MAAESNLWPIAALRDARPFTGCGLDPAAGVVVRAAPVAGPVHLAPVIVDLAPTVQPETAPQCFRHNPNIPARRQEHNGAGAQWSQERRAMSPGRRDLPG